MNIPKLKRDITNTKIINKEEIISFINSYDNIEELSEYYTLLKKQNKVDMIEVSDIIHCLEKKLSNSYEYKYNKVKDDFDLLGDFYENNIYVIEQFFDEICDNKFDNTSKLCSFLEYCMLRQKNGFQNKIKSQMLFDKICNIYINNEYNFPESLKQIIEKIMIEQKELLDKFSSDDYKENDYLSRTQILSLSNKSNKEYNLTEDDLKLNSKAFIATTIILEGTLVLGLIIGLFYIFK